MLVDVEIIETYTKVVTVEAKDDGDARQLVLDSYQNGDIVLDYDDMHDDVEFIVVVNGIAKGVKIIINDSLNEEDIDLSCWIDEYGCSHTVTEVDNEARLVWVEKCPYAIKLEICTIGSLQ